MEEISDRNVLPNPIAFGNASLQLIAQAYRHPFLACMTHELRCELIDAYNHSSQCCWHFTMLCLRQLIYDGV